MPDRGGSHEQHVKAGQQSHKNDDDKRGQQQAQGGKDNQGGQRGGSGNFKDDPERTSEAGRKGGQS